MSNARPLKFVLVGDSQVGKTALAQKFYNDQFSKGHKSTIGIDFGMKGIQIEDKNITLQIWDSAGQERFRSIARGYYRDARAIFLVYDVTNKDSFNHLDTWMLDEIKGRVGEECIIVLVGTKSHIKDDTRVVTPKEIQEKAKNLKIPPDLCFEVSAETGKNVEDMFTTIAKRAYALRAAEEKISEPEAPIPQSTSSPVRLLIMPRPNFFKRHKAEIIAGIVTALVLSAIIVPLAVVFWPVIAALVPVAVGVAIGAALGIPAITAATALAATVFTLVSSAVVAGISFCLGKFGFGKKKVYQPLLPLDSTGALDESMQSFEPIDGDLLSSTTEAEKRKILYASQFSGSTRVINSATGGAKKSSPANKEPRVVLDSSSSSEDHDAGDPIPVPVTPAPADAAPTSTPAPASTGGDSPNPFLV